MMVTTAPASRLSHAVDEIVFPDSMMAMIESRYKFVMLVESQVSSYIGPEDIQPLSFPPAGSFGSCGVEDVVSSCYRRPIPVSQTFPSILDVCELLGGAAKGERRLGCYAAGATIQI